MDLIPRIDGKVDRQLLAVECVVAGFGVAALVGLKYWTGVNWQTYLIGLGAIAVAAFVAMLLMRRARNKPQTATTLDQPAPPTRPVQQPAPQAYVDPDQTMAMPKRSMGAEAGSSNGCRYAADPSATPFETRVFRRHWKMAVRRSVLQVFSAIMIIGGLVYGMRYSRDAQFDLGISTSYVAILIGIICLATVYHVMREVYRMRNSPLIVRQHRVEVVVPTSVFYVFLGNGLTLGAGEIASVNYARKTIFEMLFFKKVQTLNLDTAARDDVQAKKLTDIIDAKEVEDAILRHW